jgi:hypothetical protein
LLLAWLAGVALPASALFGQLLVHRRQLLAVTGELAGDGDRDNRAAFAAPFEVPPALVESSRDRL